MRILSGSGSEKPSQMMTGMVMGSSDVVGLLAYAIHEQFRDDWRHEFRKAFGRDPDSHEQSVFDVGESTARRKMTYRFLADSRVMGSYGELRGRATDHFVQKVYEAGAKGEIARQASWRTPSVRRAAIGLLLAIVTGATLSYAMNLTSSRAVPFATQSASSAP